MIYAKSRNIASVSNSDPLIHRMVRTNLLHFIAQYISRSQAIGILADKEAYKYSIKAWKKSRSLSNWHCMGESEVARTLIHRCETYVQTKGLRTESKKIKSYRTFCGLKGQE